MTEKRWITWDEYEHEHLTATCPLAPVKRAIWDGTIEQQPMTATEIALRASRPGFYKLDLDDDHPHW